MSETHAVLGAAGGIGGAIVRELAGRPVVVRAVSRRRRTNAPEGVEECVADLSTPDGAARACANAAVVYHCVQPPYNRWAEEFPALNDTIVGAVKKTGAKLVFADNLYAYGPISGPIGETTPLQPESRKGRVRKALAAALLAASDAGDLRVTIGRASDYFGPGGQGSVAGMMVTAAMSGKPVRWPANADVPHTFSYLPDVARGLVVLAGSEKADGKAWVLPAAPPVTARQFVGLVEHELGRPVKLSVTSKIAMRLAGLSIREAREIPDIWYQFAAPFVVDASAFDNTFGPFQVTPLAQAIGDTLGRVG